LQPSRDMYKVLCFADLTSFAVLSTITRS